MNDLWHIGYLPEQICACKDGKHATLPIAQEVWSQTDRDAIIEAHNTLTKRVMAAD